MRMKKLNYRFASFFTALFLTLFIGCTSANRKPFSSVDAAGSSLVIDYGEILRKVREVIKQPSNIAQVRVSRNVPESALIEYLQYHPDKINAEQSELLKVVAEESITQTDPTKHLRLIPLPGTPGYSDLKVYVSHPYYLKNKLIRESNLVQTWIDFLNQAETKIMLNVFDFDLVEVAGALIEKAKSGVLVTVGIDKGTIKQRPEVSYIYDYLNDNGVKVVAVDSVTLNHQKMAILDWDYPEKAKVLFSSGNLTQSCLGLEGDLKKLPPEVRTQRSVPNANHVMTMNSWLIANLVFNELTKTMDENYQYRGSQYPILGSYQITGPGVNPETLEAYPENSVIVSFSPGGGFKNINKNIISHFIKASDGPIRMIQFAFSSKEVATALLEKAQEQKEKFNFLSIGDTPFAMQEWSQFLSMSGLERSKAVGNNGEFTQSSSLPFRDAVGVSGYKKLRSRIKIAPWYYSAGKVKYDGETYDVNAKIHHKVLSAGSFAILGTSFNFSDNAQKNNEQILVFKSKELVDVVEGMTKWLAEKSNVSVYGEAMRRNRVRKRMPIDPLPVVEAVEDGMAERQESQ